MKKEVADLWVADLRRPDIKQGKGILLDQKGGYCCLGRLCEVLGHKVETQGTRSKVDGTGLHTVLPDRVKHEAGMNSNNGRLRGLYEKIVIDGTAYDHLADANDHDVSFAKIADYIEQNWSEL